MIKSKNAIIVSIIILLGIILIFGCQRELDSPDSELDLQEMTFHAGWASETKTAIQEDGKSVWWTPGDEISVFAGNGENGGYKFTSTSKKESATTVFSGRISNNSGPYYAVYPYSNSSCENGEISVIIPYSQVAKKGSFQNNAFVSIAKSNDNNLYFQNVCGGFKFSVAHEGIKMVRFSNNAGYSIIGRVRVETTNDTLVIKPLEENVSRVDIYAPDNGTFVPGCYYYAVCAPTEFPEGVTVTYKGENAMYEYKSEKPFEVKRSHFVKILDKDSDIVSRTYSIFSGVPFHLGSAMSGKYVDKSSITEINFFTNSDKTTEYAFDSNGSFCNFYCELVGTVLNYYTAADYFKFPSNCYAMFENLQSITSLDLSKFDGYAVNNMAHMFFGCKSLKSLVLKDFCNVTNLESSFYECEALESLSMEGWDTSMVTDMSTTFGWCKSLKILDLSGWRADRVVDMSNLFYECQSLQEIQNFNFGRLAENVTGMFNGCNSLKNINLANIETSATTDMSGMFEGCSSLTSLDISSFNTRNVTSMSGMFCGCKSLEYLDLSSFNTSNVQTMYMMFFDCYSLKALDISSFDTHNVTDMSCMFAQCYALESIDVSHFDTQNVINMGGLFNLCMSLKSIDVSSFNTSKVEDMRCMFQLCTGIRTFDLSNFKTSKVLTMEGMFDYCTSLRVLDLSTFDFSSVKDVRAMFFCCSRLSILNLSGANFNAVEKKDSIFLGYASNRNKSKIVCPNEVKSFLQEKETFLASDKIVWRTEAPEYCSNDFSADGTVQCLQQASKGAGINLVFMGDGYSDRQIETGKYDSDITKAVNAFFDVAPYNKLRDFFNVYMVNIVSANETYEGITELDCYYGEGTEVGGYNSRVMSYTQKAVSDQDMDNTAAVVLMNDKKYAGTTVLYYPSKIGGKIGKGFSIAYMPLGRNDSEFVGIVQHEAGGHGFAKLADEYYYSTSAPKEALDKIEKHANGGWYKNIDIKNDLSTIKWSKFVTDERYSAENIGAYEGGFTYCDQIWRPTENSIMRYNDSGFNAPSREAIYYRVNKLAYGDEWEYNYEDFVKFDKESTKRSNTKHVSAKASFCATKPHAPIVIESGWESDYSNMMRPLESILHNYNFSKTESSSVKPVEVFR